MSFFCGPTIEDGTDRDDDTELEALILEVESVDLVDNEVDSDDDDVDTKFEIMNEVKVGLGLITFGRIMFAESAVNSGAVHLVVW